MLNAAPRAELVNFLPESEFDSSLELQEKVTSVSCTMFIKVKVDSCYKMLVWFLTLPYNHHGGEGGEGKLGRGTSFLQSEIKDTISDHK